MNERVYRVRKEEQMNRLMIISILAIIVIAILVTIDTVRMIKTRKMMKVSISNCFKAIEKNEGRYSERKDKKDS